MGEGSEIILLTFKNYPEIRSNSCIIKLELTISRRIWIQLKFYCNNNFKHNFVQSYCDEMIKLLFAFRDEISLSFLFAFRVSKFRLRFTVKLAI